MGFSCSESEGNAVHAYGVSAFWALEQYVGIHVQNVVELAANTKFGSAQAILASDTLHTSNIIQVDIYDYSK
ncbi:transcription factor TGA2 isoform X1 [Tripterygium wilfordii]|uniref:Transcription factor TGA2 isoform X1 n=1 Tax=Tripterygium wilfordii TaxID=458696 RepID=A0A7J7DXY4_TRIWF|nr:transcription factor TGA2 isoform X1 [Tripterygium wilfordii]